MTLNISLTQYLLATALLLVSFCPTISHAQTQMSDFDFISYWSFDESSGVRYDNATSGSSNNLTDNNTVASATGLLNNSADFERSNTEYLSILDSAQTGLDLSGSMSFSFWYNPESLPNNSAGQFYHYILNKWSGGGNLSYEVRYMNEGTRQLAFFTSTNGTAINADSRYNVTLTTGVWYHIVVTYDSSTGSVKWYVDGSNVETDTTNSGAVKNGTAGFLFSGSASSVALDGLLDEVSVFSRVLSSDEVTVLYNDGSPLPWTVDTDVLSYCVYTNIYDMQGTISQDCVVGNPTTTCTYNYSATTTPVQMTSDDLIFVLAVIVFLLSFGFVAFVLRVLFVKG